MLRVKKNKQKHPYSYREWERNRIYYISLYSVKNIKYKILWHI